VFWSKKGGRLSDGLGGVGSFSRFVLSRRRGEFHNRHNFQTQNRSTRDDSTFHPRNPLNSIAFRPPLHFHSGHTKRRNLFFDRAHRTHRRAQISPPSHHMIPGHSITHHQQYGKAPISIIASKTKKKSSPRVSEFFTRFFFFHKSVRR
jgi:hypothetical protein